jgi:RNA polymerase sigma factor (sigma-70 family)
MAPSYPLGQDRFSLMDLTMAFSLKEQTALRDCLPALRRYVARQVPRDDVDDVVQEVMLRLHQRQSAEPVENLIGYVFQVAASVVTDRARRNAVRHRSDHFSMEDEHHPVEQLTPDRVLAGKEQLSRLAQALTDMPERLRDVFILLRFERMSYAEGAEHLGISVSAVGKNMMRALAFLSERDLP